MLNFIQDYAECHYDQWHYAGCRGALKTAEIYSVQGLITVSRFHPSLLFQQH